jgi:hypothetical protein
MAVQPSGRGDLPQFDRRFLDSPFAFTRIGTGALGGKAAGLLAIKDELLPRLAPFGLSDVEVRVPTMAVIGTDHFDEFLQRNRLMSAALSDEPDDRIAHAFQKGELPAELVGDLRALVARMHAPLALRSSSLLEDALEHPFAGVYATKMIPNNQPAIDARFQKLVEAVKFVYASTFFRAAKAYVQASRRSIVQEKMAVIVQEVVGSRHGERFYPAISGVARSWNYYPIRPARPRDGVVSLALGLGKSIVDGGVVWFYSPALPGVGPPAGSPRDLLRQTQLQFWCVNMGKPAAYDPVRETEYLARHELQTAWEDGTLALVASTYDPQADRLIAGVGVDGVWVVNFAPILVHDALPLNDLVRALLAISEEVLGHPVEIEFALDPARAEGERHRFGFLQVRPLAVADVPVEVDPAELALDDVVISSETALGNGVIATIKDIVYVRPERFEARLTPAIARELEGLNQLLLDQERPYLLIGFGRWGSSDPWLGIPVQWGQISGARAVVEATLPDMDVEASQGSHFFHNLSSFRVCYFWVKHGREHGIDWAWLDAQPAERETEQVRHVRLAAPLTVKVDGRSGRGVIRRGRG